MSACRGCGKEIVWAVNRQTGAKVPLDPRAHVYTETGRTEIGDPIVERAPGPMVTHFATCPKANDFSGSKAKGRE
jgi:hypothetical protein